MTADFGLAFTEAVTCADRESTRYALGGLELRGNRDEIIATDRRHLLQQTGLRTQNPLQQKYDLRLDDGPHA